MAIVRPPNGNAGMKAQQASNACWAAVIESLCLFNGSIVRQCSLMTSASGSNCCCNGTICQTAACNVQAALSDMLNPPIVDIGHSYRERRLGEFDFSNVVDALRTKLVPLRVAWSQPDVPGPLTNGHFVLAVAVDDQKQSVDLFDPWPVGSKPAISLTASWHTICNNYRPEIGSAQHGARLTHAYL